MTNDEIFFLCALTGAKGILGIESPVNESSLEIAKEKWQEVSKGLIKKEIISYDDKGEICICDEYEKISVAMSFPDVAFDCSSVDGELSYIYIKGSLYVHMIRKEECELRLFENRQEFIEFINQEFMFSFCESEIKILLSVDDMNKVLEFIINDKMQQALEVISNENINIEDTQLALTVFISNYACRNFIGYKQNQETPSEAIFKTVRTENETWLFKIWNNNVKMIRCNPNEALAEVINF